VSTLQYTWVYVQDYAKQKYSLSSHVVKNIENEITNISALGEKLWNLKSIDSIFVKVN